MNPCPCGFAGDAVRECRCTPQQIARYRGRLSGPLRDRLDLTVDVPALPPDVLGDSAAGEPSAAVRARVVDARARQQTSLRRHWRSHQREPHTGAAGAPLPPRPQPDRGCCVQPSRSSRLSARGYDRVRKVARTIADLAGADAIEADHIAEALQFRTTT